MMIISFQELSSQWRYHVEEFHRIQDGHSFWMDRDYVWGTMMPAVVGTVVVCSILFWLVAPFISDKLHFQDASTEKIIKARYQFTNFFFNFFIGGLGLYYYIYVLPTFPSYHYDSAIDRIPGHTDLYIFSALQLGYQLWALPVGLYCVRESTEMIVHHLAVVLASTMSGFSYCGFRYVSVYFYGLMELSSIPLAIMNAFKDNPDWRNRYPFCFLLTKAVFSFSFLYIRIYMWFAIGPRFLMHDFFMAWTVDWSVEKIFLTLQFVFGMFLGGLQFYWAYLVTKGMVAWFLNLPSMLKQRFGSTAMENGYAPKKTKTI
ncbi:TLC domain containing protein [Nitzschia inconspicua]|uniref:TLC domain containing protein n=1 Tax=Nitzschia inconspicua TaxID=303405 RepID=A0A9K3KFT0_9STRA|nr:TLC domain containing protein [Nitzschia inconspicua]KAG7342682.1 TLC domain containing protein [Nitzschia inconspicua]